MRTNWLLTASAVVMGVAGIAATFGPAEVAGALGLTPPGVAQIFVQVIGALYLGFAMVNWMARGSLIGGIYNRPLLLGNLAHVVVGGLALVKHVASGERPLALVIATGVYVVFAVAFGRLLFTSPVPAPEP